MLSRPQLSGSRQSRNNYFKDNKNHLWFVAAQSAIAEPLSIPWRGSWAVLSPPGSEEISAEVQLGPHTLGL